MLRAGNCDFEPEPLSQPQPLGREGPGGGPRPRGPQGAEQVPPGAREGTDRRGARPRHAAAATPTGLRPAPAGRRAASPLPPPPAWQPRAGRAAPRRPSRPRGPVARLRETRAGRRGGASAAAKHAGTSLPRRRAAPPPAPRARRPQLVGSDPRRSGPGQKRGRCPGGGGRGQEARLALAAPSGGGRGGNGPAATAEPPVRRRLGRGLSPRRPALPRGARVPPPRTGPAPWLCPFSHRCAPTPFRGTFGSPGLGA